MVPGRAPCLSAVSHAKASKQHVSMQTERRDDMAGTHDELLAKQAAKGDPVHTGSGVAVKSSAGLPAARSLKPGELETVTSGQLRRQQTAAPVVSAVRQRGGTGTKDNIAFDVDSSQVDSGARLSRNSSMPTATSAKEKEKKLTSYKGLWEAATGGKEADMTVATMEEVRIPSCKPRLPPQDKVSCSMSSCVVCTSVEMQKVARRVAAFAEAR